MLNIVYLYHIYTVFFGPTVQTAYYKLCSGSVCSPVVTNVGEIEISDIEQSLQTQEEELLRSGCAAFFE